MPKCPSFNNQMKESPELASALKIRLCRGDGSMCARFVILHAKSGITRRLA